MRNRLGKLLCCVKVSADVSHIAGLVLTPWGEIHQFYQVLDNNSDIFLLGRADENSTRVLTWPAY
jgi:hypothetical protein